MKIYLVCQYFYPEIGAPQARLLEMAREWVKNGHQVTVLTGFPNHPTGIVPEQYRGRIFQKEQVQGIRVWRHWVYATPNKGFLRKILSHLSFMASLIFLSLFRGLSPDVVIVSSPTFFSVFSAWLISLVRRALFVFEVRDLWPGIFVELGVLKNPVLIKLLEFFELTMYRLAHVVVPVTRGFADDMKERGIDPSKIHVITNGVDLDFFSGTDRARGLLQELGVPRGRFVVSYVGAHGISHGLACIVKAADRLKNEDIQFVFVGEGAVKDDLIAQAGSLGLGNVTFINGQQREFIPQIYCESDLCLVPLKSIEGFKTFIPSKMFEIMASGRPIVASLEGEAAEILRDSGGAIVIPPEDTDELAKAIIEVRGDTRKAMSLGCLGREFVRKYYDRKALARRYLELITSAVVRFRS